MTETIEAPADTKKPDQKPARTGEVAGRDAPGLCLESGEFIPADRINEWSQQ